MGYMENNIELLKAMNTVVLWLNDENAYDTWILYVPDEADDDDFAYIAKDDAEMSDVCKLFRSIMRRYGSYGWFTKVFPGEGDLVCYGEDDG